jgi:hypothetical protein
MSIGNLKDSGNQGNNFPWQLKMLQGLQALIDDGCCVDIFNLLSPQARTHNILRVSAPGTIVRPYSFSIANVGSANGTLEGKIIAPGEVVNYDAGVLNNSFELVTYDATDTTFLITWVS